MKKITQNIRLKLLLPFIVSLLIAAISVQSFIYSYEKGGQERLTKNLDKEISKSFNNALEMEIEKLNGYLFFSLFKKMSGFFPAQEVSPSYETRRF